MSQIFRVDHPKIGELLEFSEKNPWKPIYPRSLVQRFLTELISTEDLIFDFHDQRGRAGVAVLLDKVNNLANDACLELLGMRPDADQLALWFRFIALAKEATPKFRSGFQVGLADDSFIGEKILRQSGLAFYYNTFEMRRTDLKDLEASNHSEITHATPDDRDQIYLVLCDSFAQNPDTSIPDEATWKENFLQAPKSHFYIWKANQKVCGFATLFEGEGGRETEIRTIGVLPNLRGQDIGRHLLHHCLNESLKLGHHACHLTVAVTNQKALGLYLQAGFKIMEKHKCYRIELNGR